LYSLLLLLLLLLVIMAPDESKKKAQRRKNSRKKPQKASSDDKELQEPAVALEMRLPTDADSEDDSDEEELQAMAASWAEQGQSDDDDNDGDDDDNAKKPSQRKDDNRLQKKKRSSSDTVTTAATAATTTTTTAASSSTTTTPPASLSLHVTQLAYELTEWELREFFMTKTGIQLKSVRLVYDQGLDGRPVFRGVAFVDCHTVTDYEAILRLHQVRCRGRRINVRPTKSKQELAQIVEQRDVLVQQKLLTMQQRRDGELEEGDSRKSSTARDRSKKKPNKRKRDKDKDTPAKAARSPKQVRPSTDAESSSPHKLSKKERNRRAAIIMSKRRR
jgi:RNA recognition motif-containing protein